MSYVESELIFIQKSINTTVNAYTTEPEHPDSNHDELMVIASAPTWLMVLPSIHPIAEFIW
jgi:hypothetical protein